VRTTIELPDSLFKQAKVRAIEKGVSLKDFVREALEHELEQRVTPETRQSFPVLKSRAPGTLQLTNVEIDALLEDEDGGKREPL
jgi:plasmid stability protein